MAVYQLLAPGGVAAFLWNRRDGGGTYGKNAG